MFNSYFSQLSAVSNSRNNILSIISSCSLHASYRQVLVYTTSPVLSFCNDIKKRLQTIQAEVQVRSSSTVYQQQSEAYREGRQRYDALGPGSAAGARAWARKSLKVY